MDGGYDDGYTACSCFWGDKPGSLIRLLEQRVGSFSNMSILDVGCGEGKNSIYLSRKGASVDAIDISEAALKNAKKAWADYGDVNWECRDIRNSDVGHEKYDIVIAYGLLHCMSAETEVESVVQKICNATKPGGYVLVCAFNDRKQDLSAHPGFSPYLLPHGVIVSLFKNWYLIEESDEDLYETHPHNNIPHSHSLTRIVAEKR